MTAVSAIKIGDGHDGVRRMACMEIWGGNSAVETTISLPGLTGWVHSRPMEPASEGGDVYYLSVCSAGVLSRIVLADVAGHGDAVATAAINLRDLLRKHVSAFDQSELMRGINEAFGGMDGELVRYATAAVLGYYCETKELVFANAGHPPGLWYRAAEKQWSWLNEATPYAAKVVDGLPLGLIPGTEYTQTAVQLGEGDIVVLYTDGVTESFNEKECELGYPGLLNIAQELEIDRPEILGAKLLNSLRAFRGTIPCSDDLSLVILQQDNSTFAM